MQYQAYEQEYADDRGYSMASDRLAFIRRTYAHLAGAILAMIGLEAVLLSVVDGVQLARFMTRTPWMWLLVLLAFMGGGFVARIWAQSRTSVGLQYLGLGLFVALEAVIFLPILVYVTQYLKQPDLLYQAGILTAMVFGGLTLAVFTTKKDYSHLRPILCVGSMIAFGVIICAIIFGFTLGLVFSFFMVALISGFILYDTSNVLHHYPTDMHVAAALELFADAAILFWYILRIVMALSGGRD